MFGKILNLFSGKPPLLTAIMNNQTDNALRLIESEPNTITWDDGSGTPLHYAAFSDNKEMDSVITALLKKGAKKFINQQDGSNSTPLMLAAMKNNTERMELLIEYGAKLDQNTLFRVIGFSKPETIMYMVERGTNAANRTIFKNGLKEAANCARDRRQTQLARKINDYIEAHPDLPEKAGDEVEMKSIKRP